eukprot:TRINITY_DN37153_c0_g1_i1.p1 TRINITY_DN37153_c0_g1~~TRINITY_DN37153_c0_g1_i1.p1  ORF type:complete len:191 (+),score=27.49 TRINITY_DN37153_c0_g1_i1:72-575(+)
MLRKVCMPLNVFFSVFGGATRAAEARMVKYHNSPFKASIERSQQTGEDLATTSYGKFVAQLILTIPDRFVALGKEFASMPAAIMGVPSWKFNDYMMFLHLFVRLAFIYLVGVCLGRQSLQRPIPTSSLFFQEYDEIEINRSFQNSIVSMTGWTAPIVDAVQGKSSSA